MGGNSPTAISRRQFLGAAVGTGASSYASGKAATRAQENRTTIDVTDGLVFDPDETTIPPGSTVVWKNVGSVGHSVIGYEDEIPDEAEHFASAGFDSEQAARDAYPEGEVAGDETYCWPASS
ncbi:plastocyanin/azurin family copper-binding protein [Halorussus salinisoli]|uniref:plastocyanin/azurin family copper-binding protein n=1 Tax=Halorussus salinisoli TaxID=2558242 RepID=UPI0010C2433A|nr:plastocyanin/azurin family copper-binding protein [Halorussus salinisoli]